MPGPGTHPSNTTLAPPQDTCQAGVGSVRTARSAGPAIDTAEARQGAEWHLRYSGNPLDAHTSLEAPPVSLPARRSGWPASIRRIGGTSSHSFRQLGLAT